MVLPRTEELEFISSAREIEDFLRSVVWRDLENFIKTRIESGRDQLERTDLNAEELARWRGIIAAWRDIQDLPETILEWLQEDGQRQLEIEEELL